MSLDFSLERVQPVEIFSANQTHNVSNMWTLAGIYDDLYGSEGMKASDVLTRLQKAYKDMKARPSKYKKLNPENGWGSYETALSFLHDVIEACELYPDATIRISA
jgi:hypothetical protein